MKSVLWRVTKHLSYREDARCLKVKLFTIQLLNKINSKIKNTNNRERTKIPTLSAHISYPILCLIVLYRLDVP